MTSTDYSQQKLAGARELLLATKRNLQLVDARLDVLQNGRQAIVPADDVSTEHRIAFLGAVDESDQSNGILFANGSGFGFQSPHRGIIRNQEDAGFVCTKILVATARLFPRGLEFVENVNLAPTLFLPMLRLIDGNTGRNLITGMTSGPQAASTLPGASTLDKDRGAVSFSYFSSVRPGLGSNVKNKLFSEFTITRAGVVNVEVFNTGTSDFFDGRAFVTLLGFKVYGG